MQRPQLEHVIRAAAGITGAKEFVIVGNQAVLGQFPNAPEELLISVEADMFSPRSPADADLIDGSIGEGSPFHMTFGYHAHGVGEETAILPAGWKDRLILIHNENTGGGTGLCLEVHDLAVSKLVAGREKDLDFIKSLLHHQLANQKVIGERLRITPISLERHEICLARLKKCSQ